MNWTSVAPFASIVTSIVALVGIGFASLNYRRSVQTRRAELLLSLHEKFFEIGRYTNVRRVLDYSDDPGYPRLIEDVSREQHSDLADEFYRYLNFFELLAGLLQLRQISIEEIVGLFDYDLHMIARHSFIADCLEGQGFERLPLLLGETTRHAIH